MREVRIPFLLRELSTLVRSGLPLPRALELLSRESPEAERILEAKERLERGEEPSEAFRAAGLFPDFVCEMLIAARTGESLEGVLERAAELISRMEDFRNRITGALIYPALVIGFGTLAVLIVLRFIVPRLRKILLSFGRDLPLPTKVLLWGAKVFWWGLILGGPLAGILIFYWVRKRGLSELHRVFLRFPVFGRLWLYFDLSRWSYTTALLLRSGVVLPRAVAVGGRSCANLFLRQSIEKTIPALEEGRALSATLRRTGLFPDFILELSAIGEESGTLSEMLENASEILMREAQYLMERILRWVEPLAILIIGFIVAYIVVSVILPIMEISSAVKL